MFTWQPGRFFWAWIAALLLLGLVGATSGGVGGALWFMSLVPLVTSVVAFIRRRRTLWFGTASTSGLVVLLAGSLVLGAAGIAVGAATAPPSGDVPVVVPQTSSASTRSTPTQTPTPTPTPSPTPSPQPATTPPPAAATTETQPIPAPAPVTTEAQPAPAPVTTEAQPAPAPPPPAGDQFVEGTIKNGAFCKKENAGWYGYTSGGVRERCTLDSDNRYRWLPA